MSEAIAATYGGGNTFIMDEKIPLFAGQRVMITVTDAFAENMHDNAEKDVERRNAAFARLEAWRKKTRILGVTGLTGGAKLRRQSVKNMVLLIDANVIMSYITNREPGFAAAYQIVDCCREGRAKGYIAFHTVSILWYVL